MIAPPQSAALKRDEQGPQKRRGGEGEKPPVPYPQVKRLIGGDGDRGDEDAFDLAVAAGSIHQAERANHAMTLRLHLLAEAGILRGVRFCC